MKLSPAEIRRLVEWGRAVFLLGDDWELTDDELLERLQTALDGR